MIWKEIKGIEEYSVSDSGTVRNDRTSTILKSYLRRDGYMSIVLFGNGKYISKKIHRLVAEAFLENKENKKYVNHKDEDKTNNNVSNLEWCTASENMKHLDITKRKAHKGIYNKPVLKMSLNGDILKEYFSIREAARDNQLSRASISKCIYGVLNVVKNHKYKFK